MVAQDRIAARDRRGQLGFGAADLRRANGVDIEIEPTQTDDVGIASGVASFRQPLVRPGQESRPDRIDGDIARHASQPVGLGDQSGVVVEPAGDGAPTEARSQSVTAADPALAIKRGPQYPQFGTACPRRRQYLQKPASGLHVESGRPAVRTAWSRLGPVRISRD